MTAVQTAGAVVAEATPELTTLERQQFDVRIADDMEAFVQAARAEGLSVLLSSGYRSYAEQTYLFNRKVAEYGEAVAQTIVARPGTSEHQTGLCCDITDRYYEMKDRSLEDTELYQWMSEHCQEYGFIVRFPDGKEDVTGIIYSLARRKLCILPVLIWKESWYRRSGSRFLR